MKMKIAIITHYYKSENYGGCLQAYALCKILNSHFYDAEQLSYEIKVHHSFKNKIMNPILHIKKVLSRIKNILIRLKNRQVYSMLYLRKKAFESFNSSFIPHSAVYNENNIIESVDKYEAFITGSDQVWNPLFYCSAYFLDFVPSNKIKVSYAASISQNQLTTEQQEIFRRSLHDYRAISVREENAVALLKNVSPVTVELVLDPTLLLSRSQWEEICSPRIINEDYIFCYFLGNDINERVVAKKFAENHKLKIVTLPHLLKKFRKCDKHFGDHKLFDISPTQFISLFKYAQYIFTDSFHAAVFSNIFHKQYFVFERSDQKAMSSRIYSLCKLFKSENRFCDTSSKATFEYINSLPDIIYTEAFLEFEILKKKSLEYLWKNLAEIKD